MTTETLFAHHLRQLQHDYAEALTQCCPEAGAILLYSGDEAAYFQDDQFPPFKAWAHFLRWVPVDRPGQFVWFEPGRKPALYAIAPQDFWHDQSLALPDWWADEFDVVLLPDSDALQAQLVSDGRAAPCVFLGDDSHPNAQAITSALDIPAAHINPTALLAWLDYERAYKTPYEVHRIAEANALAITGHQAAHDAFLAGADEYDVHLAYLQACRTLDEELPYPSIVAINEHAATLHYQHKQRLPRGAAPGQVLLIDAGCRVYGYCSDITRTWAAPSAHPVFLELLTGMTRLQRQIIAEITVGGSYLALHQRAHGLLAELLVTCGIANGRGEELVKHGVAQCFMPHGLGHMLGLQVHDTGGRQIGRDGTICLPPDEFPALRMTRQIEPGMVFTIEPGVYFIPMLLDQLRAKLRKCGREALLNWSLIAELTPMGGIRIEDNILVKDTGIHNLTRQPLSPAAIGDVSPSSASPQGG